MVDTEYLVVERLKQWWVLLDGLRLGPYVSRQIAVNSAIAAAKIVFKSGQTARVSLQNGELFQTLYDSTSDVAQKLHPISG